YPQTEAATSAMAYLSNLVMERWLPERGALHAEQPLKDRASGLTENNEIGADQCKRQQHWPSTQFVGRITKVEGCEWFAKRVRRVGLLAEYF
ncbi:MAG TPA: hypothetical protein VHX39_35450, partial [Acetobacteraceae bacterium]|nr:hypothetical protein [Acetobacteraceae bacterium]